MSDNQLAPASLRVLSVLGLSALKDPKWSELYQKADGIAGAWNVLSETELARLPENPALLGRRPVMLPFRSKDGVRWLHVLWIVPRPQHNYSGQCQLSIVIVGDGLSFGFRFEPPEGEGDGLHNYYHAQPITHVRTGEGTELALGIKKGHVSTDAPAFPLYVDCPLALLDALLLSLYGPGYLEDYGADPDLRSAIRQESPRAFLLSAPDTRPLVPIGRSNPKKKKK